MSGDTTITVGEAAREHLGMLSGAGTILVHAEVERFVRWAGADRDFSQLTAHQVASYAETLAVSVTDAATRSDAVKKFLAFANKAGYTSTNLATHLRIKRGSRKISKVPALETIEMREEDKMALVVELESLKVQRPEIIEDIKRAMADKDFKENAPLDAARERQAYTESRIRKLEMTIDLAVIVEDGEGPKGDVVELGSKVVLRNLKADKDVSYTLVRPAEADASQGRISFESPVGQAVLKKRVGDEVEVVAPSGTIRFRIESLGT